MAFSAEIRTSTGYTHGHSRESSAIAWEFHLAVETLRKLDAQNVPAIRRSLRCLDRATQDLFQYHQRHDSDECPVVFPDHFSMDLQNILSRPYFSDEQAQQLLANILGKLYPFVSLSPNHVEVLLSLLLSARPCSELEAVWLQFLVHSSHDGWAVLMGGGGQMMSQSDTASYASSSSVNAAPWFERLFLLLQRALGDFSDSQWSAQAFNTKEYAVLMMWRSITAFVLDVVTHLYNSQATLMMTVDESGAYDPNKSEPMDILTWMQASLARHMQRAAPAGSQTPAQLHGIRSQCFTLLEMTIKYAHCMAEYAMDALDGALVAAGQGEESSTNDFEQQQLVNDAMHNVESAFFAIQVTYTWKILPNFASMVEGMWKQCSQAFIGKDEDGIVARMVLDLAKQYLQLVVDQSPANDDDDDEGMTLDESTFIMTLFRASESCPTELLEASVVWKVIASELQASNNNSEVKSVIQAILFSLLAERTGQDDPKAILGHKFLRLMNEYGSKDDTINEWEALFLNRFTSES